MLNKGFALFITEFVMMHIAFIIRDKVFRQQPDAVSRFQLFITFTAFQLLAVYIRPIVHNTGGQAAVTGELDFNLINPLLAILGFDIDNAEFIRQAFLVVIRVEDFHRNQRFRKLLS